MIKISKYELLISALLLIFSFPPFQTGGFALFALVPLFVVLEKLTAREAWKFGFLWGLIWAAGTVYWIAWPTKLGFAGTMIIVPLYSVLFFQIFVWLHGQWGKRVYWFVPVLWTAIEMLSSIGPFTFPWNMLGYTQTYALEMVQIADLIGVFGVSMLVVVVNVLIYLLYQSFRQKQNSYWPFLAGLLFVLAGLWGYGKYELKSHQVSPADVRISLAQGNIDPQRKWTPTFKDSNFTIYQNLTAEAAPFKPHLIVWPETAAPTYLAYRAGRLRPIRKQLDSLGVPLLTGSPDFKYVRPNEAERYNAALFISPDTWRIGRYHKNRLVPFSERVPGVEYLPFLLKVGNHFKLGMGNYTPGKEGSLFEINLGDSAGTASFAPFICYDSVFPETVSSFMKLGAGFLVLITNDGWFGNTSGPYQHANMAVMRAIENRSWIARCANSGISSCISPVGEVTASTRLNTRQLLNCRVGLSRSITYFARHCVTQRWIVMTMALAVVLYAFLQKRLRKK